MSSNAPRHLRPRSRWRVARRCGLACGAAAALAGLGVGLRQPPAETMEVAAAPASAVAKPLSATRTTTTSAPPRKASLVFAGDVLIHSPVWKAAATADGYDFGPMLAPIAPILSAADVAVCHLEVTIAAEGEKPSSYPRFRAPPELVRDLAGAGFDGCSVASNHALDFGASGIASTLDALDREGLAHVGTARSAEEDRIPATYSPDGMSIAHLSYAYGFNGYSAPAGQEWAVDVIDPVRVLEDAHTARAAGAEFVVVSLHWGSEYRHEVTARQLAVAEALAADVGAVDLVVGHHAHVVQPISKVGEMWVVWGMGNLLSNNSPSCCTTEATDGVLVSVDIADDPSTDSVVVDRVMITPTWNERSTYQVLPASAGDPASETLAASFQRTLGHVLSMGGSDLGVTVAGRTPSRPEP